MAMIKTIYMNYTLTFGGMILSAIFSLALKTGSHSDFTITLACLSLPSLSHLHTSSLQLIWWFRFFSCFSHVSYAEQNKITHGWINLTNNFKKDWNSRIHNQKSCTHSFHFIFSFWYTFRILFVYNSRRIHRFMEIYKFCNFEFY